MNLLRIAADIYIATAVDKSVDGVPVNGPMGSPLLLYNPTGKKNEQLSITQNIEVSVLVRPGSR